MKPEWYYTSAGQQYGPYTAVELKEFATKGKLKPEDLVWKEGMANWVAAKTVKGIFAAPAAKTPEPEVEPESAGGSGPASDFAYEQPAPGGRKGKAASKPSRVEEEEDRPSRSRREESDEDDSPRDDQADDFDDRKISVSRGSKEPSGIVAYLTFKKMIVPVIIQIIFWFGVLGVIGFSAVYFGGILFFAKNLEIMGIIQAVGGGLIGGFFGILFIRIYCELLMVAFRINNTLSDIKVLLDKRL